MRKVILIYAIVVGLIILILMNINCNAANNPDAPKIIDIVEKVRPLSPVEDLRGFTAIFSVTSDTTLYQTIIHTGAQVQLRLQAPTIFTTTLADTFNYVESYTFIDIIYVSDNITTNLIFNLNLPPNYYTARVQAISNTGIRGKFSLPYYIKVE